MNNRYFIININDCFLHLRHRIRKVWQASIRDGCGERGKGGTAIRLQVRNDLRKMMGDNRVCLRRGRERMHDRIDLRSQHVRLNHQVVKFDHMPLT